MTPAIRTHDLTRRFDDEVAIDHLDLDVHVGEIHAVVGLNGAGKTTLMRLMLGMLRPDSGTATVLGEPASTAPPSVWSHVGHQVGAPLAYPELTVRENLRVAALLHGVEQAATRACVEQAVDRFELGRWADRRASALSSGNRQRLGIATAVVHDPTVLLLDEPSATLDPAGVVLVRSLLLEAKERRRAVLVSSHHLDELARVADRITVLHRGRAIGALDPDGFDLERRFFELVHAQEVLV